VSWLPQSDDQFFYWDWCIRNGVQMTLECRTVFESKSQVSYINGFPPASASLHRLVADLKAS
jgi:hypothetical protein